MSAQPKFRVAAWLAGSLFALLAVNFLLILFVSGTDIFLGQPPQFMVPLLALLVASTSVVVASRSKPSATHVLASPVSEGKSRRNTAAPVPVYISMTIIRRLYVADALVPEPNEWEGAIQ